MSVYLSLDKREMEGKTRSVLCVRILGEQRHYPLTKAGCRQAGADLYDAGAESWMHSSSLDFPKEYGFRHDPHELVREGWEAGHDKAEAPRKSLVAKMIAHAETPDFRATLTDGEKAALAKMKSLKEEDE